MLKAVAFAVSPVFVAIATTAALAWSMGDISKFLFDGPATGGQSLVIVLILFLPLAAALALTESLIRRLTPGSRERR